MTRVSCRHAKARIAFRGVFPLDMLRYDACHPESETDAHVIEESVGLNWGHGGLKERQVHVTRLVPVGVPDWTVARWESFGCKVFPVKE